MTNVKELSQKQGEVVQPKPQSRGELVPVSMTRGGVLQPTNLPEAIQIAQLIARSGMLPKNYDNNPGAVFVAMQMGAELGLPPLSAIQNIAVINGRPSLWGDAMLALVMSHPDCEDVIEEFDETSSTAKCTVKRRGRIPKEGKFSMADAKIAGLLGKPGPWTQYPKRMLQQRARGFALRDSFPDALRGIISVEEAGDIVDNEPQYTPPDKIKEMVKGAAKKTAEKVAEEPKTETVSDVPDYGEPDEQSKT